MKVIKAIAEFYRETWNAFMLNPPPKDAPIGPIITLGCTAFVIGVIMLGLASILI